MQEGPYVFQLKHLIQCSLRFLLQCHDVTLVAVGGTFFVGLGDVVFKGIECVLFTGDSGPPFAGVLITHLVLRFGVAIDLLKK